MKNHLDNSGVAFKQLSCQQCPMFVRCQNEEIELLNDCSLLTEREINFDIDYEKEDFFEWSEMSWYRYTDSVLDTEVDEYSQMNW